MGSDRGSGAVIALALVGATLMVALAALTLGSALVVRQRVIDAADASALAAADTASGALAGDPCPTAQRVAWANGAVLSACRIDGLIATVEASARFGLIPVTARARAGPPP
jgi:secretion/DNA translocation related TadE-like protein